MSDEITEDHKKIIIDSADKVIKIIAKVINNDSGVHVETAVSGAGAIAGSMLLLSSGADLSDKEAGSEVENERVHELGVELARYMIEVCKVLDFEPEAGWDDSVPEEHQPKSSVFNLSSKLVNPFIELCDDAGLPEEYRQHQAAFTALKLVKIGSKIMSPEVGKSIIMSAILEAGKTVPL